MQHARQDENIQKEDEATMEKTLFINCSQEFHSYTPVHMTTHAQGGDGWRGG